MDRKPAEAALIALGSDQADLRADAAERLADFLDYGRLSRDDVTRVVDALLEAVCREPDPAAWEAMMNALVAASVQPEKPDVSWVRLVSILETLDSVCLAYALEVLGNTQDARFGAVIKTYLAHESAEVREAAGDALVELGMGS